MLPLWMLSNARCENNTGIGVILLDYDGSPEYNERAYHSFRNFSQGLSTVGMIPGMSLKKHGTILMDGKPLGILAWHRSII